MTKEIARMGPRSRSSDGERAPSFESRDHDCALAIDGSEVAATTRVCQGRVAAGVKVLRHEYSLSCGYRCFVPLISFSNAWAALRK
jgi:hypothetical protein